MTLATTSAALATIQALIAEYVALNPNEEGIRIAFDRMSYAMFKDGAVRQVTEVGVEGIHTYVTMERQDFYEWDAVDTDWIELYAQYLVKNKVEIFDGV